MANDNVFYATGKRKSAVSRTWIKQGTGKIIVNGREMEDYFQVGTARVIVKQPLVLTNLQEEFDINVKVSGGGISGQAGAVRHGITRALMLVNPELRGVLKKAGYVTRDPRIKERKKYGQRGARARYQFSKR